MKKIRRACCPPPDDPPLHRRKATQWTPCGVVSYALAACSSVSSSGSGHRAAGRLRCMHLGIWERRPAQESIPHPCYSRSVAGP